MLVRRGGMGLSLAFAAKGLVAGAGMLRTQAEGLACNVRIGNTTQRAYVVTAAIFEGATDAL